MHAMGNDTAYFVRAISWIHKLFMKSTTDQKLPKGTS